MLFGDNSGYVGALRRSTKVTQWGSEATRKKNKEQFQRINVLTRKWKRKEKERKEKEKKKNKKKKNV